MKRLIFSIPLVAMLLLASCGEDLAFKIRMVKGIDLKSPATAINILGKYAYVVSEDGKLRVFDISNLDTLQSFQKQIDVFKGNHVGLHVFNGKRRLLLQSDNGRVALVDISTPGSPSSVWGLDKSAKLLPRGGATVVNQLANMAFITPGDGSAAIYRLNLGRLDGKSTAEQATSDKATLVKTFAGGGGGGIAMPLKLSSMSPAGRLCIGNRSSNKLDLWLLREVSSDEKPVSTISIDNPLSGKPALLFSMERYLILSADSEDGGGEDWVLIDFERDFNKINNPTVLAKAAVGPVIKVQWEQECTKDSQCPSGSSCVEKVCRITCTSRADCSGSDCTDGFCGGKGTVRRRMFTSALSVHDFGKVMKQPQLAAEFGLAEKPEIRGIVVRGDYIYTAEKAGFRIYRLVANE